VDFNFFLQGFEFPVAGDEFSFPLFGESRCKSICEANALSGFVDGGLAGEFEVVADAHDVDGEIGNDLGMLLSDILGYLTHCAVINLSPIDDGHKQPVFVSAGLIEHFFDCVSSRLILEEGHQCPAI